jgi:hypothetical protein
MIKIKVSLADFGYPVNKGSSVFLLPKTFELFEFKSFNITDFSSYLKFSQIYKNLFQITVQHQTPSQEEV